MYVHTHTQQGVTYALSHPKCQLYMEYTNYFLPTHQKHAQKIKSTHASTCSHPHVQELNHSHLTHVYTSLPFHHVPPPPQTYLYGKLAAPPQ